MIPGSMRTIIRKEVCCESKWNDATSELSYNISELAMAMLGVVSTGPVSPGAA